MDELHDLWVKGVETWDEKEKKNFTLHAILLGQLMISPHMRCYLVGAQKVSLLVLIVTRILITCG
jgi:hypothetical protein